MTPAPPPCPKCGGTTIISQSPLVRCLECERVELQRSLALEAERYAARFDASMRRRESIDRNVLEALRDIDAGYIW